jgi:hypothetical protein
MDKTQTFGIDLGDLTDLVPKRLLPKDPAHPTLEEQQAASAWLLERVAEGVAFTVFQAK